jgi:hypothetical protein
VTPVELSRRQRTSDRGADLEPWYAEVAANEATIAKARADFGEMILTWDAILANPGPYTVTSAGIVGR